LYNHYNINIFNLSINKTMENKSNFQIWLAQTRANFLLLAVFLVAIGLTYAAKYGDGGLNIWHAILVMIGTISAHISVNLFNEYSDYKTKIDFNTQQTPFSGGSKMLITGKTKPRSVYLASVGSLVLSAGIGIYFSIVSHWSIALISVIGAFAIVYYTPLLAKMLMGEFFAGLTLGSLVVLGTYIVMNSTPGMSLSILLPLEVLLISIPPGILTSLLLLLNEFPDSEADKAGGRYHLVIKFGKKKAAWVYAAGIAATFGLILILPLVGISSPWIYLALLPLPLAIKSSMTAIRQGNDMTKLMPAMGMNVMVVLATDLLIAVAVFIQIV
jgi:1,4-dihydroxy-2-naphthoate polyprenyltransferase